MLELLTYYAARGVRMAASDKATKDAAAKREAVALSNIFFG